MVDAAQPRGAHVGKGVARTDGRSKVTGETRYIDDQAFDGMYGATVRTPIARGRIRAIRFGDGVDWRQFVIVTHRDVPISSTSRHKQGAGPFDQNRVALIEHDQPYLVRDTFRHKHEAVVLLAHPDKALVQKAAKLVSIDCEPLPAVLDYRREPTAEQIQHGADNVFKRYLLEKGAAESVSDFEAVFASAAVVVEGRYETGAQEQAYIEPQGVVARAELDPEDQAQPGWPKRPFRVRIEGSLQCPYYVHQAIKHLLDLPDDAVEIAQAPTGGGFGGKEDYPSVIAGHAVLLSMKARAAVKMIYDRVEDMQATTKRHPCQTRIRTALDAQGRLLALDIDAVMDGGAYVTLSPVVLSRGTIHAAGPYQIEHVRVDSRVVLTNTAPYGAFRGFGAPQTIFAMERHLDRCADRLGLDPAELRRRNLVRPGGTLSTGQVIGEPIVLETWLDRALDAIGYAAKRERYLRENAEAERSGLPLRRGVGLATFMHGAGFTGSGEDYLQSVVEVRATPAGGIEVLTANTEIGQGANTVFAAIAADTSGLDLGDIVVAVPDTRRVPNSGPTVASRTSMVVGHLVARACDDLVARIEQAELLPAPTEPALAPVSELAPGRGRRHAPQALRKALAQASARGDLAVGRARYEAPPGGSWDDKTYRGTAYGTYAWATYVCDLEVDTTTMEVAVRDFVALQEIGRVLHPVLAEGQIAGGVVQGLGWALLEDVRLDAEGGMANANLTSYVLPTMADVPRVRVLFEEMPYGYGPFGAKGIGELPMDGPAPAVVNALSMALGVSVDAIPATPERLLALTVSGGVDPN